MSLKPLLIEQEATEAKLAFAVHQHSSLQQIRLVRAKIASALRPENAEEKLQVVFQHKGKQVEAAAPLFRVAVSFKMTGKRTDDGVAAVVVECDFEADYEMAEGFALSPEAARAFKDGNAIFNVWPYFREYLQSSLQRMGLPPLTAPFLRLQPKPPKVKLAPKAAGE